MIKPLFHLGNVTATAQVVSSLDGKFINSKGVNGIIREIEGYVKGIDRD